VHSHAGLREHEEAPTPEALGAARTTSSVQSSIPRNRDVSMRSYETKSKGRRCAPDAQKLYGGREVKVRSLGGLWTVDGRRWGRQMRRGRRILLAGPFILLQQKVRYFLGASPGMSFGGTPMTFTPAPRAMSIASMTSAYFTFGSPLTKMIFSGRGS